MGLEIFSSAQYAVGAKPNIQFKGLGNRIYFGQTNVKDSFENNSLKKFCNESEINKMISQNPELKNLLIQNKIPHHLNMKELNDLFDSHCKATQDIAAAIAGNLPPALKQQVNIKVLKDAAMLHDFGKVLIPSEVLNKNGALTNDEHKIMDLHSEIGYQLLKNSGVDEKILNLVRYHHENFEDTKSGRNFVPDINLQILNLADKYSALTEKRVYKEKFSPQKALTILYSEVKNGKIHPFVFNALVKSLREQLSSGDVKKC